MDGLIALLGVLPGLVLEPSTALLAIAFIGWLNILLGVMGWDDCCDELLPFPVLLVVFALFLFWVRALVLEN